MTESQERIHELEESLAACLVIVNGMLEHAPDASKNGLLMWKQKILQVLGGE